MAFLLKADGVTAAFDQPRDGRFYQLEELKCAIGGGFIELVHLSTRLIMVIDADAKLKAGMPVNLLATAVTRDVLPQWDLIVGDALIITADQLHDGRDDR